MENIRAKFHKLASVNLCVYFLCGELIQIDTQPKDETNFFTTLQNFASLYKSGYIICLRNFIKQKVLFLEQ